MSDIKKDKSKDITKRTESDLLSKYSGFLKNQHHTFSVLKAEKLASAIYMVTSFIPENDPLRIKLRTSCLEILSLVTEPTHHIKSASSDDFGALFLEVGGMLGMAEKAGLISPMNTKILSDEYASLGLFIQSNEGSLFGNISNLSVDMPEDKSELRRLPQRRIVEDKNDTIVKRTNNHKRHQNRRQIILSLLDKKDKINVKDAASAIEGCSEKTIQRELTSMVDEGVLLKEGERRWSVYKKAL